MRFILLGICLSIILIGCQTVKSPIEKKTIEDKAAAGNQDKLLPRALGESKYGKLLVVPKYEESIEKLGVSSCYGLENDYRIKSDYDILFKTNTKTAKIDSIDNLTIINPKDTIFQIKKIMMGERVFFYFIPQYTDCHGIAFYLYEAEKGIAFPIHFQKEGQLFKQLAMLPKTEPTIVNGMFVIKGGYAAGMDNIPEYYFTYDPQKHLMKLKKTVATSVKS